MFQLFNENKKPLNFGIIYAKNSDSAYNQRISIIKFLCFVIYSSEIAYISTNIPCDL